MVHLMHRGVLATVFFAVAIGRGLHSGHQKPDKRSSALQAPPKKEELPASTTQAEQQPSSILPSSQDVPNQVPEQGQLATTSEIQNTSSSSTQAPREELPQPLADESNLLSNKGEEFNGCISLISLGTKSSQGQQDIKLDVQGVAEAMQELSTEGQKNMTGGQLLAVSSVQGSNDAGVAEKKSPRNAADKGKPSSSLIANKAAACKPCICVVDGKRRRCTKILRIRRQCGGGGGGCCGSCCSCCTRPCCCQKPCCCQQSCCCCR